MLDMWPSTMMLGVVFAIRGPRCTDAINDAHRAVKLNRNQLKFCLVTHVGKTMW